jgi:uncharacterized protein (DUF1800 family)
MPAILLVAFLVFANVAAAAALTIDEARHLLARAGLGPTAAEIAALAPLTREQAVDLLLAGRRTEAVTPAPEFVAGPRDLYRNVEKLDAEGRKAQEDQVRAQGDAIRAWWFAELLATPSPLTERMAMTWHNHFVSSFNTVRAPDLLFKQNVLFRRHALGDFRALVHEIARDRAMMKYLDTVQSKKTAPNENFARELLELFTLGEGHYGETDIKELARVFTAYRVNEETGSFRLDRGQVDDGDKTILGRTAKFDAEAAIDHILAQPQAAVFIVERLWREFINERPDPAVVAHIAARFRESWDIATLVRDLLTSEAFWSPANRGQLIKSPVDLLVGSVRLFRTPRVEAIQLANQSRRLGLDLFVPPTVKGWTGGAEWINADTLLVRRDLVQRLLRGAPIAGAMPAQLPAGAGIPAAVRGGVLGAEGAADIQMLLLAAPPFDQPRSGLAAAELAAVLVADPAFQVK